jgi:hypothetical protein
MAELTITVKYIETNQNGFITNRYFFKDKTGAEYGYDVLTTPLMHDIIICNFRKNNHEVIAKQNSTIKYKCE